MLVNRKWCYWNSSPYLQSSTISDNHPTQKLVISAPRAYLWPVGFRHSFADAMFYVRTSIKRCQVGELPLRSFFLFQSSHAYRANISEVKSFLLNQSVWDARKPIFYHILGLKWGTSTFCVIQDGGSRSHVGFFGFFFRWKPTWIWKAESPKTSNF